MTTPPEYLLIGHVTADIKQGQQFLGGTVSYALPVALAFGQQVAILTSARADEPLLTPIVPQATLMNLTAPQTTVFENVYHAETRTQTLHSRALTLEYAHVPSGWQDVSLVHLAPVANEIDPQMLTRFPNSTVLLTPQGLLRQWDKEGRVTFKRWFDPELLQAVNVVVFSKQDIAEDPTLEHDFASVVDHVFVTDGARGGIYYQSGVAKPYEAIPAIEVDPTGAGDVFATALLACLPMVGFSWLKALEVARHLAALSVTHSGIGGITEVEVLDVVGKANHA